MPDVIGRNTINQITAAFPRTIAVLNDFGVDVCCGGDVTVAEAADRDGVNLVQLRRALEAVIDPGTPVRSALK